MARIAMDETQPIELRAKMYAELAPYGYAKRKAVEITGNNDGLTVIVNRGDTKPELVNEHSVIQQPDN